MGLWGIHERKNQESAGVVLSLSEWSSWAPLPAQETSMSWVGGRWALRSKSRRRCNLPNAMGRHRHQEAVLCADFYIMDSDTEASHAVAKRCSFGSSGGSQKHPKSSPQSMKKTKKKTIIKARNKANERVASSCRFGSDLCSKHQ